MQIIISVHILFATQKTLDEFAGGDFMPYVGCGIAGYAVKQALEVAWRRVGRLHDFDGNHLCLSIDIPYD